MVHHIATIRNDLFSEWFPTIFFSYGCCCLYFTDVLHSFWFSSRKTHKIYKIFRLKIYLIIFLCFDSILSYFIIFFSIYLVHKLNLAIWLNLVHFRSTGTSILFYMFYTITACVYFDMFVFYIIKWNGSSLPIFITNEETVTYQTGTSVISTDPYITRIWYKKK